MRWPLAMTKQFEWVADSLSYFQKSTGNWGFYTLFSNNQNLKKEKRTGVGARDPKCPKVGPDASDCI